MKSLSVFAGMALSTAAWAQPFHLDPSFGTGGIMIDTATLATEPYDVAVQPDGKILAIGWPRFVQRYLANGDPDPAFTAPALPIDSVYGIALQSDGRILLAGEDYPTFMVVRLLEGGALDTSFGGDGIVTTAFGDTDWAADVEVQADGKIVAAGRSALSSGEMRAAFARYLTDGSPDPGFGSGGKVVVPAVADVTLTTRLILDSQGRIVTNTRHQVIRLVPGGAPDASFGTQGVLELPPNYVCTSIAGAPNDAVLVIGDGADDVALLRYTSGGVLDATFGDTGLVRFGGTSGLFPSLWRAVTLADGSSYVTGSNYGTYLLARFLNDGTIDETFGLSGFLLTRVGLTGSDCRGLAVQTDGAILQVGWSSSITFGSVPALVRSVACAPPSQPPPTISSVAPNVVPAGAETLVNITGTNLGTAVQVRIGIEAPIVGAPTPGMVQATTRIYVPMGLADVDVITDDCQRTTMSDAVFVHPIDVPPGDPYYPFVRRLIVNEVTAGCSPNVYCRYLPVTRAQMAVFLLRSKEGPGYEPPPATGTVFTDVAIDGFAAAWIEELSHRGITAGCDAGLYCPDASNTRAQMAVFLLVTLEGTSYQPPDATGVFADVPISSPYARWVEEIHERGITAGCDATLFCPDAPVLREQMAVFLSVTFNLPG